MTDRAIVYDLSADTSDTVAATGRATRALEQLETGLAQLTQQLGRSNVAGEQFVRQQQSAAGALQRTAEWERALGNIRAAAQDQQRRQFTAQQQFVEQLQREADAIGRTRVELLAQRAAQLGVTAQAQPLIARLAQAERGQASFARTSRLSAMELQQLSFQLNDLAVQVASGGNPLVALMQQGSQLSGTFGGVGNALRAVASLITPAVVAFGALGIAATAAAVAAAQGYREHVEFERALTLTGNRAGLTAQGFADMAREIQRSGDITIGASRSIVQGLLSTGELGSRALASVADAAAVMQRESGQTADEVVKDFASITRGALRWAQEKDRALNFLTAEQVKYVRALEAQGRQEEAIVTVTQALSKALNERRRDLGLLERSWRDVTQWASNAWDAMMGLGRPETLESQLARVEAQLQGLMNPATVSPEESNADNSRAIADLQAQRDQLKARADLNKLAADARARIAEEEAAKKKALDRDAISADIALQRARDRQSAAAGEVARQRELQAVERQYQQLEISAQTYIARRAALEERGLAARLAAIDREIDAERRTVIETNPERVQQQARLLDLETRRFAVAQDRLRLQEQIRRGFDARPREVQESPAAAFRQLELAQQAAVEQGLAERRAATMRSAREIEELNRDLGIALIADERQRAIALLDVEERTLRQRLDLAALGADERRQIEDQLALWRAQRERQVDLELRPQWQRQLDAWRDHTRLMREASDDFHMSFLSAGESAFQQWFRTGKLSAEGLGNALADTLGTIAFRRYFAEGASTLATQLFAGIDQVLGLGGAQASAQEAFRASELAAQQAAVTSLGVLSLTSDGTTRALFLLQSAAEGSASALASIASGGTASGLAGLTGAGLGLENLLGGGFGSGAGFGFQDLGLFFAAGGAFARGHVQAFARGGILGPHGGLLTRPTIFPMANGGIGLGGEAGTEAVMPLTRTRGGKLGVLAGGGTAAPVVNVNVIGAPSQPQVRQRQNDRGGVDIDVVFEQFRERLAGEVANGGPFGAALERSLGVSRAPQLLR